MVFSLTLQKTTDMLLSFTLSNFRSFKAKKTLDLTAATIKEYEESLFSKVGLSVLLRCCTEQSQAGKAI